MPRKITLTERLYYMEPGERIVLETANWPSVRVLASRIGKIESRRYSTSEDRKTGAVSIWRLT